MTAVRLPPGSGIFFRDPAYPPLKGMPSELPRFRLFVNFTA